MTHFTINTNSITFYPNNLWKRMGIILFVVFFILTVGLFVSIGADILVTLQAALYCCIIILPLVIYGNRAIIVNGDTQTIQKKSWRGTKTLCTFADVAEVVPVDDTTMSGRGIRGYYKLALKKDRYGKGIRLCFNLTDNSAQAIQQKQEMLPFLDKLLHKNILAGETNTYKLPITQFKMYKNEGTTYTAGGYTAKQIITSLFFVAISVFMAVMLPYNPDALYMYFVPLIPAVISLAASSKIIIDIAAQTITKKRFFGLYKKQVSFTDISHFSTLKHLLYGIINTGTDIIVHLKTGKQVTIFDGISKSKNIAQAMDETKYLLTQKI